MHNLLHKPRIIHWISVLYLRLASDVLEGRENTKTFEEEIEKITNINNNST